MQYKIYKLEFLYGVHFGNTSLDESEYVFSADTFFSALCQEAVKSNRLMELLDTVSSGQLVFTDAFPYVDKEFYLPKPMIYIERAEEKNDSTVKKTYKNLKYIPISGFDNYLSGKFQIEYGEALKRLGTEIVKTSASVRGEVETLPYQIGVYYFAEGNGLYLIAGYESEKVKNLFESLMEGLSLSGIGGKRSSGLGRFDFYEKNLPEELEKRITGNGHRYMTLSISLPKEEEMEKAIEDASYLLKKRSGFVSSENYAEEQLRKKDLYVFQSGSCFKNKFAGDIYDVSKGGRHPVYRYEKPFFMEVDV